jgi:hypothetical protein
MMDHIPVKPSRSIAPLLATCLVLLGGVTSCIAIIFAFGDARPVPIAIALACVLGVGLMLWLFRDKPEAKGRSMYSWLSRRDKRVQTEYALKKVQRTLEEYGQRQPPTLEELRELRDDTRTWVPSHLPGRGSHGGQPQP